MAGDTNAIIGVADHSGWAVLVTVGGDATLLDRCRVELVEADLPCMPYHTEGQKLPVAQAVELVERVRASAEQHAARLHSTRDAIARRVFRAGLSQAARLRTTCRRARSFAKRQPGEEHATG